jgi:hypothetical protein
MTAFRRRPRSRTGRPPASRDGVSTGDRRPPARLERRCEIVQIQQVGQPPARLARRDAKQCQGLRRQRGQAVPRAGIERREHDAVFGLVQLGEGGLVGLDEGRHIFGRSGHSAPWRPAATDRRSKHRLVAGGGRSTVSKARDIAARICAWLSTRVPSTSKTTRRRSLIRHPRRDRRARPRVATPAPPMCAPCARARAPSGAAARRSSGGSASATGHEGGACG